MIFGGIGPFLNKLIDSMEDKWKIVDPGQVLQGGQRPLEVGVAGTGSTTAAAGNRKPFITSSQLWKNLSLLFDYDLRG